VTSQEGFSVTKNRLAVNSTGYSNVKKINKGLLFSQLIDNKKSEINTKTPK